MCPSPLEIGQKPNLVLIQRHRFAAKILQNTAVTAKIKGETAGIERLELVSQLFVVPVNTVLAVPQKRVADMSHVGADLVGAPRHKLYFKQTVTVLSVQNAVFGDDLLAAGQLAVRHLNGIVFAILAKPAVKGLLSVAGNAVDNAIIKLPYLIIADLFVHQAKSLRIFGRNDNTACVAVNSITKRRRKGLLRLGIVLTLPPKIRLDVHDQRIVRPVGILMNQYAGTLVAKEDIFILITDLKLWLNGIDGALIPLG